MITWCAVLRLLSSGRTCPESVCLVGQVLHAKAEGQSSLLEEREAPGMGKARGLAVGELGGPE